MIVVSDTSPISNLHVIGRLHLLHDLFGAIVVPRAVISELSKLTDFGYDISAIENAPWLSVQSATDILAVTRLTKQLDPGESEAIVLAQELGAAFLLIDERRGWKIANAMGIKTIGVLGVLLKAKSEGLIPVVSPVLHDIESIAGFWMSESLRKEVLLQAGE